MKTLRRQLKFQTYQPVDWALNCACLSQYFITRSKFAEAKHCLACANVVIEEADCEDDGGSTLFFFGHRPNSFFK